MFELIICATFTLLPDYLYRRYRQGKRLGREITFFSVWFELRWQAATTDDRRHGPAAGS